MGAVCGVWSCGGDQPLPIHIAESFRVGCVFRGGPWLLGWPVCRITTIEHPIEYGCAPNIALQAWPEFTQKVKDYAGSNNSIGLPSGSSNWICLPPGPTSILLRRWSPAFFSASIRA